jgi:branched-subunit amino acid ABC-type transport system permease component
VIDLLNFYLIPGIVLGSIYALGAIGVSLIFGILRFAHFAHGDMMTLGAYLALPLVLGLGWSPYAALPAAMIGASICAVGIDRVFYKPLRHKPTIILLVASFGIALMLRSAIQFIWGPLGQVYEKGFRKSLHIDWLLDGLRLQERHIYIVLLAALLVFVLHLFLTRTKTGKAMRALSDDPELARVSGINTERIVMWTWILGASLAAAGGVFLGMDTQINTLIGWNMLLPVFAAAILGGIGKPYGAIAGGLVIGMAEELSAYPFIGTTALLEPTYKSGVAFAIMVAMLLWRPSGLFRGRVY